MEERLQYSEVRQMIIDMLKMDLLGPTDDNETLSENPRYAYVVGMLAPQTELDSETTVSTCPVPGNISAQQTRRTA